MITVFGSINLDLIGTVERLPRAGRDSPGQPLRDGARRQGRKPGACRGASRRGGPDGG